MSIYGMDKDLKIIIRAARIMLQNGAETYRVEDSIDYMAERLGLRAQSYVTPTGIFVMVEDEDTRTATRVRAISNRGFDLSKLDDMNQFSRSYDFRDYSWEETMEYLASVDHRTSKYPRWFIWLCAGLASGGFAFIFGENISETIAAVIAGTAAMVAASLFSKRRAHLFLNSFLGGLTAMLVANLMGEFFPQADVNLIIIGGVMPLVPGVAITSAARDLVMDHLVSGLARAGEALMVAAAIAVGVAFKYFL